MQLPNSLEEVESNIQELRAKADTNYITNPNLIHQYEQRKKEVKIFLFLFPSIFLRI
jgi:hypothetical protein